MISEEEFLAKYGKEFEGPREEPEELRATGIIYNESPRRTFLVKTRGEPFSFKADDVEGLRGATDEELMTLENLGSGIHWPLLNVTFSVEGLKDHNYGKAEWMAMLGREGGKSTSPKKQAAARNNGHQSHGRPKNPTAGMVKAYVAGTVRGLISGTAKIHVRAYKGEDKHPAVGVGAKTVRVEDGAKILNKRSASAARPGTRRYRRVRNGELPPITKTEKPAGRGSAGRTRHGTRTH